jgi:EAL domain-containing protein (putative c-di-GMP-specific phosphodiesterase class I)
MRWKANELSTATIQPQFELRTGKIIGAEALLRWFKKDNSAKTAATFISPAEFIPVAEQSGLIVPMGEWVLSEACKTAADWGKAKGHDIRIAVNVSGAQFYQNDLVSYVERCCAKPANPTTSNSKSPKASSWTTSRTRFPFSKNFTQLGVELAIDDFGTGYSSLSYLRQFPIDRLKIDQSFIRNALNDPDDASIARTIVALGRALNLKVIAEGVETKEHEAFLKSEKCDEVQGYRYSRPIPADKFMEFLNGYNGNLAVFDR